ncbi:MAG: DUF192 domain-containing protein [Candidatus Pacearchaeota archaeon]|jgi:uncharacterized membrane protein (UPF0127 family)
MQVKVGFQYKKKKFSFSARKCSELGKVIGLMFSRRENAKILLFEFSKPVRFSIHSLFVFFPFVAIWLDENGRVIQIKTIKPFTLSVRPRKSYKKLLEIPINKKEQQKLQFFVGN